MIKIIKIVLTPFIPLYAAIIWLRNLFFDIKIFKSSKVDAFVLSVGNITMGGSGKTPLVLYLIDLLKSLKRKPGVLSRGYGRQSKGYKFVSDGKDVFGNADDSGDEIIQTVTEAKIPGAVSEDRVKGANRFLKDSDIDTIILDDAFQHRWIYRDLDLVVCEQSSLLDNTFFGRSLLPAGNMREPIASLKRADAVIINRKFSEDAKLPVKVMTCLTNKSVFKACYKAMSFVDIKRNTEHNIEEFKGQISLVVSGIANPLSLINALKQSGVNTDNQLVFRDHKQYKVDEIQKIRKAFYAFNAHSVITTHKDAVKLSGFTKEFDDIDIFYLKIKMEIDNKEQFISFLENKIRAKQSNS